MSVNAYSRILFYYLFFLSVNIFAQYKEAAKDLSKQIDLNKNIKLAVLTFPYIDGFESVGSRVIQEKMINAFQKEKNIVLVERGLLSKVLEEKKLEMSGLFDDKTVSEVGKFLGVDAVLTGTLNDVDEKRVEVNARIINVLTGEIMASSSIIVEKTWGDKTIRSIFGGFAGINGKNVNLPNYDFKLENFDDIDNLELYDEVVKYDRSEANALEKAGKWKEFGLKSLKYKDMALKRAKEWEDYDKAEKERKRLEEEKAEMMKKDYEKLKRILNLSFLTPKQKNDIVFDFINIYGDDNKYKDKITKYIIHPCQKSSLWGYCYFDESIAVEPKYDFVSKFYNNIAKVMIKGKCGYIDRNGKEITNSKYKYCEEPSGKLMKIGFDNKYGFVDNQGKIVIPIKYEEAHKLSREVFLVKYNGKYGLINISGNEIVKYKYEYAIFYKDYEVLLVLLDKKYGFIDINGEEILPLKYDELKKLNENLFLAVIGNKKGLIDIAQKGKIIVPVIYDEISFLSDKILKVKVNNKYNLLGMDGKKISLNDYDNVYDFKEDMARVENKGMYGFIDLSGKEVIPTMYSSASDFSEGLSAVQSSNGDKYFGFIDKNNNIILPFKYMKADPFYRNRAIVIYENFSYGLIDKSGKDIVPPNKYSFIYPVIKRWKTFYQVHSKEYKETGNIGLINYSGEEIVPTIYSSVDEIGYDDSVIVGKNIPGVGIKYGLFKNDREVIPVKFDSIFFIFKSTSPEEQLNDNLEVCLYTIDYKDNRQTGTKRICAIADTNGNMTKNMYDFIVYAKDMMYIVGYDGKYGMVSWELKQTVPLKYDYIGNLENVMGFKAVKACAKKDCKYISPYDGEVIRNVIADY